MAKSLLLNILVDILGNYVEDLTQDHLKLAVWSGKIELFDLKLKKTALDKLKLPITVGRGCVKRLSLNIPWANLNKKPVSVIIDGIFLEAGPLDLSSISKEESERMKAKSRLKKMEKVEHTILASIQNKEELHQKSKKLTFIKKLANKIIDNLEVKLTNLHIRYEDQDSIPGSNFSCGITIESMSLATTDDNWLATFINREIEKKHEISINKLVVLNNCNFYWNTSSTLSKDLSYEDWQAKMLALIYSSTYSPSTSKLAEGFKSTLNESTIHAYVQDLIEPMSFILSPPNQSIIKVTSREVCSETMPSTDVLVEGGSIPVAFHEDQYRQIILLGKVFKDRNRRKFLVTHRPPLRPTEDPVAWWHYAYRLLTGHDVSRRKMSTVMQECVRCMRVYIPFCRRNVVHKEVLNDLNVVLAGNELDHFVVGAAMLQKDRLLKEVKEMEDTVPLNALVVFRQVAAREAIEVIKELRNDSSQLRIYIKNNQIDITKAKSDKNKKKKFFHNVFKSKTIKIDKFDVDDAHADKDEIKKQSFNKPSKFINYIRGKNGKKMKKDIIVDDGIDSATINNSAALQLMDGGDEDVNNDDVTTNERADTQVTGTSSLGHVGASDSEDDTLMDGYSSAGSDARSISNVSETEREEEMHFDEDDDADDGLEETLAKYSLNNKKKTFTIRLKSNAKITVQMYVDNVSLISMHVEMKSRFEKKRNKRTLIVEIDSFAIHDSISEQPISTELVSMLGLVDNAYAKFKGAIKIPAVDNNSDVYKRKSPRMIFLFESDRGHSVLNLRMMPMLVVWNEQCIKKLLQFLRSTKPVDEESSLLATDKRNKFSAIILKKFLKQVKQSGKVTNTGKKLLVVELEIYAPVLIFPEVFDMDSGCLNISFHKLLIKGNKDRLNMTGSLLLNNINIIMSDSFLHELDVVKKSICDDRLQTKLQHDDDDVDAIQRYGPVFKRKYSENEVYLVRPFDIRFDIEQVVHKDADSFINITVHPHIDVQIRALNIIRLKYITDCVIKSLQPPKIKSKSKQKSKLKEETELLTDPADIDFVKPKFIVHFNLPSLMVCLILNEDNQSELCLNSLEVKIVKRAGDIDTCIDLDSISLTDSKRPESHPRILWTDSSIESNDNASIVSDNKTTATNVMSSTMVTNDGNSLTTPFGGGIRLKTSTSNTNIKDSSSSSSSHDFTTKHSSHPMVNKHKNITFRYLNFTSPYSPLYEGDSKHISFTFCDLNIAIDDGSISRFSPFITKLINSYKEYYPPNMKKKKKKKKNQTSFGNSSINFSMTSISLDILQDIARPLKDRSSILSVNEPIDKMNHNTSSSLNNDPLLPAAASSRRQSSFFKKRESIEKVEEESYENAFHVDITNIVLNTSGVLAKADYQLIETHITSFSITDVRRSSEKFAFKTLLCRNVGQLESDAANIITTTNSSNNKSLSTGTSTYKKSENILDLKLEKNLDLVEVDVHLLDMTSYVSLDVGVAFANLINSIMKALKKVKSAMRGGKKKVSDVGGLPIDIQNTAVKAHNKKNEKKKGGNEKNTPVDKVVKRSLTLTIVNPRLFLLENPEDSKTKAIVTDCNIHLLVVSDLYTYDGGDRYNDRVEFKNSIHLALKQAQVFVWTDMQAQSKPHKIVEPMGVDVHLERSTENDVNLMNYLKVSSHNIRCRVSLNDIALTSSILSRAKLNKDVTKKKKKKELTVTKTITAITDDDNNAVFQSLTMNVLHIGLGQVTLTLLNDYHNQNIPIIKVNVEQFDFSAGGSIRSIEGEGSLQMSAEYYNSSLSNTACWEPVIESWHPVITFIKDQNGTELCLSSDSNVQLNVTGPMCKCIYGTMTLASKIGKEGTFGTRRNTHALVVCNQLGVPIELFDSSTKESLVILSDDLLHPISSKAVVSILSGGGGGGGGEQTEVESFPELFDIHLIGVTQRQPIFQAPILTTKPKLFHFQPCAATTTNNSHSSNNSHGKNKNNNYNNDQYDNKPSVVKEIKVISEPVNEEVYENQRYYPLNGGWAAPWRNFNEFDIHPWTDVHNKKCFSPVEYELPDDGWEWIDPEWRLDIGKIDVETDKDGWHYESSFSAFSTSRKKRRAQRPLDVVRRRRWIRTRLPIVEITNNDKDFAKEGVRVKGGDSNGVIKSNNNNDEDEEEDGTGNSEGVTLGDSELMEEWTKWIVNKKKMLGMTNDDLLSMQLSSSRPLPIFWEVITKSDESREIRISSGLRFRNELHCPVEIEMLDGITEAHKLSNSFVIPTNDSFGIPLSLASFSYFHVRPITNNVFESYKWCQKVSCKLRIDVAQHTYIQRINCMDTKQQLSFYLTIHIEQSNKQMIITFSSGGVLFNRLPCKMSYHLVTLPDEVEQEQIASLQKEQNPSQHSNNTNNKNNKNTHHFFSLSRPREEEESLNDLLKPFQDQERSINVPPPLPPTLAPDITPHPSTPPPPVPSSPPPALPPTTTTIDSPSNYHHDYHHDYDGSNLFSSLGAPPSLPPMAPPEVPLNLITSVDDSPLATMKALYKYYNTQEDDTSSLAMMYNDLSPVEVLLIDAGDTYPIADQNFNDNLGLHITIGEFTSIVPLKLGRINLDVTIREYSIWLTNNRLTDNNPMLVSLSVKTVFTSLGVLQIYVYSPYLLIDLANCGAIVKSDITLNYTGSSSSSSSFEKSAPSEANNIIVKRATYMMDNEYHQYQYMPLSEQLNSILQDDGNGGMDDCWVKGYAGVTMFQSGNDSKISLGVNRGGGWLNDLSMHAIHADKSMVEVIDEQSNMVFNLALSLTPLTTAISYCPTYVLKVMPAYVVINCMYEDIQLLHASKEGSSCTRDCIFDVESQSSRAWHRPYHHHDTLVHIRSASTTTSIGTINLNEVGTNVLILPGKDYGIMHDETVARNDLMIVHIEVKLADDNDPSYMNIIVWRSIATMKVDAESIDENNAVLAIKNETDFNFNVLQDGIENLLDDDIALNRSRFDLNILPRNMVSYGWVSNRHGSRLNICIGSKRYYGRDARDIPSCMVDIEKPDVVKVINLRTNFDLYVDEVYVVVKSVGNGSIVYIYTKKMEQQQQQQQLMKIRGNASSNSSLATASDGNNSGDSIDRNSQDLKMMMKMVDDDLDNDSNNEGLYDFNHDDVISADAKKSDINVKFKLQSISISFCAQLPTRRELFCLYIEGLEAVIRRLQPSGSHGKMDSLEVKLLDMQVDNYADAHLHPVLFSSSPHGDRLIQSNRRRRNNIKISQKFYQADTTNNNNNKQTDNIYPHFIHFSIVKEIPRGKKKPIIKYLALRVLEFKLEVDSSTILIYFSDLHCDLIRDKYYLDYSDKQTVKTHFQDFSHQTLDLLLKQSQQHAIDPKLTYEKAQVKRLFFETLIIHPLKIYFSFTPTYCPRFENDPIIRSNRKLRLLVSAHSKMPAIEDFEIRIGSFIINSAMESFKSMKNRVIKKTIREIKSNLILIAGNFLNSISFFGNPSNLVKHIGAGVQDFFYEPYLGLTESPGAFVRGVGKGSVSLLKGMALSTASILGSATESVSTVTQSVATGITGDSDYVIVREDKRRDAKGNQGGGMIYGIQKGGRRVIKGVTSGITGLVIKPIEETKKSGALGFIKGVGIGVIGLAVKPVLGVTDGISTVVLGFTKEITDPDKILSHIRPPRAFQRVDAQDSTSLVLVSLDLFAAEAQLFMLNLKSSHNNRMFEHEEYISCCNLGFPMHSTTLSEEQDFGIVISQQFIFILSVTMHELWHVNFTNLSHVVLKNDSLLSMVGFVMYGSALPETKNVVCANKLHSLKLYSFLLKFSHNMGNPSAIVQLDISSDILINRNNDTALDSTDNDDDHKDSFYFSSSITYVFGYVNPQGYLPYKFRSERQIIIRAAESFAKIALIQNPDSDALFLYYRQLDEAMWSLVSDWRNNHKARPSRCNVCMILNNCPNYMQIIEIDLVEGRDYVIFGVGDIESTASIEYAYATSYDPVTRSLRGNGGVLVIFAYGHVIRDSANVDIKINTTGFTALVSTKKNTTHCVSLPGFSAGYLEKSQSASRSWTKSVISVELLK